MPDDKDITLGEVYRAVLSLKEEFVVTRKEISEGHNALRDEQSLQSLRVKELEVEVKALKKAAETLHDRHNHCEHRVGTLEKTEPKTADPMARIGVALGAGLSGLVSWYLSRGG